MNKCRYIVSWCSSGGLVGSKIYKYRKSAFTFATKLDFIFGEDVEVMVECQERKEGKWIMTGRWMY